MTIIPRESDDGKQDRATAALAYTRRSIPVFPLHSVDSRGHCSCGGPEVNPKCKPGKHPHTKRGHLDASTDPARICQWWRRWPNANIGIPTGKRSRLLTLDVDTYNWGAGSLETLENEHAELPETTAFQTGRGGMQLVFRYPADGPPIRNSTGQLGRGLDVRGEGGYIVVPPSRTEGRYEWLERRPLADPPKWLLELLRKRPGGSENASGERAAVSTAPGGPPIPDGERNNTLAAIAGRLHDGSRNLEQLASELMAINVSRCVAKDGRTPAPLPEPEVIGIAHSIHRLEPCKPAPEPDEETQEAVAALVAGTLERLEWKKRSGPTDRAVYAALLLTARQYGRRVRSGVRVSISVRALALAAGVGDRTVINALDRLQAAKLVYRPSRKQAGPKAGALLLRLPQTCSIQPRGGDSTNSAARLRDVMRELLRVRWGPGRIGKLRALLLEMLARHGPLTVAELSRLVHRRPDNVRRTLKQLQARALVECPGDIVRLVPDFAVALQNELEATGTLSTEQLQRERHERQRAGYVAWLEERRRERRRRRKPDGYISDLKPLRASGKLAPDAVITDAKDPERFREFAALARERVAEHRHKHPAPPRSGPERAALLLRRLHRDDPECFAALRSDPRALAWEVSGRGWTETIYCGNTIRSALEAVDRDLVPADAVA
jgi:hypothetical protein